MRNCFVPICDAQCRNNPMFRKRKMFLVPKSKEIMELWINALPKLRAMKSHDKVCERHFSKDDIITTYDHIIEGQMFQMERGRARLKKNAVPSLNLPTAEELATHWKSRSLKYKNNLSLSKASKIELSETDEVKNPNIGETDKTNVKNTKDLIQLISVTPLNPIQLPVNSLTKAEPEENEELQWNTDESSKIMEIYNTLYDEIYEVVLPSTLWGVHRCPERTIIFFSYVDPVEMRTTKMVSITESGSVKIFLANKQIYEFSLANEISSTDALSNILSQANDMLICPKAFESDVCQIETASEAIFCKNCEDIFQEEFVIVKK